MIGCRSSSSSRPARKGPRLEQDEFIKKKSEAIKEARLLGVRPMEIGRLLTYLGYDYHAPVRGRPEAVDKNALKRLLAPKQRDQSKPARDSTGRRDGSHAGDSVSGHGK